MKIVIAIDGDLLVSSNSEQGMQGQINAVTLIAPQLGALVKAGHQVVILHGNAPQVGFMLLRGEAARHIVHALPLDICGADTQGATGYMLQQALRNWLDQQGCEREVLTLITQVVAGETAPVGAPHTKGIGPFFDRERALELAANRGWDLTIVPGQGYQRVVPCLEPKKILEINSIRTLFEQDMVVVCSGGGGIPIAIDNQGKFKGVEAVVDKAYTAFLLAEELDSDLIIFVSPWERIIRSLKIDPYHGSQVFDLQQVDDFLGKSPEIEDTIRHKLIASQIYLQNHTRTVRLVQPDQLGSVTNGCVGIQLVARQNGVPVVGKEVDLAKN